MSNDYKDVRSPESEKLMFRYAKQKLRNRKANTQRLGFNISAYASLSIASAKVAFVLQNSTQPDYIPASFAVLSAGLLVPAFKKISECNQGYYSKFPKELIKGLSVPLLMLPLALDGIKIEPFNPDDPYGFNTAKQDNVYYRGYQSLAEEHGLTLP